LTQSDVDSLLNGIALVMLTANRINQTNMALLQARGIFRLLASLKSIGPAESTGIPARRIRKELASSSAILATTLANRREYTVALGDGSFELDPRFLLFEFCHSLILRKSQVQLVSRLVTEVKAGGSACCQVCLQFPSSMSSILIMISAYNTQMIMGAGKTTVVGPLLSMLLADAGSLVTEVI